MTPKYEPYLVPPCPVMCVSPGMFGLPGSEQVLSLGDMSTQVCEKADAQACLDALVLAEGGPLYKATPALIQEFGNDQAPTQRTSYFQWIFQPGETRRNWSVYMGVGAGDSIIQPLLIEMFAQGRGAPGKWVWGTPPEYQRGPLAGFKTYYWQPA